MKGKRLSIVMGSVAVTWSIVATLWLMFWSFSYQGVEVNPDTKETARVYGSLIEVNGYSVVFLLLIPVALAVAGFWASRAGLGSGWRKAAIWASAVMLLLFCVVGLFSIGLFYIPAAGALMATAIAASRRVPQQRSG